MIPNTIPYTRQLPKAAQHRQDREDVKRHITRVVKAIAFSPKHLVEQVLTGDAKWIEPSLHQERMAQRVAIGQPPTHGAYLAAIHQQQIDHNRKIGAAITAEQRFIGARGYQYEAEDAETLQVQADWAMLTLLTAGAITHEEYQRFQEGGEKGPYVRLSNDARLDCLPIDPDKRDLCRARIGQEFIDKNRLAHERGAAEAVHVADAEPYLQITLEDIKAWKEIGEF